MNTDRKIGFAMGILLIGLVAALFFRNEPLLDPDQISVNRERELNQRLRDRDVSVYPTDPESTEASIAAQAEEDEPPWTLQDVLKDMNQRNRKAPAPVVAGRSNPVDGSFDDEELDGYRRRRNSGSNSAADEVTEPVVGRSTVAMPSPQADKPVVSETSPDSRPLPPLFPNEDAGEKPAPGEPAGIRDSTATEFDEYIIKYGDTLSAIAERTLGSRGKYLLIYEANRDRMSSPDRLSPGKPLRIPRLAASPQPLN